MNLANNQTEFKTEGKDFVITRIYNAPRNLVWKAWTDPDQLAQWFGPTVFSNRCEIDLKPGGHYKITMVSLDGVDYPMDGTYREIIAPEKLVMTVNCDAHPQEWHDLVDQNRDTKGTRLPEMIWAITFEETTGKTKLTICLQFTNANDRDALLKLGMKDGWAESLDKLDNLLSKISTAA